MGSGIDAMIDDFENVSSSATTGTSVLKLRDLSVCMSHHFATSIQM